MANLVPASQLVHAHRLSVASVVWTLVAGATAIVAGVVASSLLLISFGAIGLLDAIGSGLLVVHFRHALHHQAICERRETRALTLIAFGMGTIAMATSVESAHRLVAHTAAGSSAVGNSITAASIAALAALAMAKVAVGERIESRALVADGHVSGVGACIALVTLGGTVATSTLGWWWVDPTGSLSIAAIALTLAARHMVAAATS